ncbi:MAG: magnesium and cobalt transport protein CorA [Acidobacteria bacterium]|jgi:magnesium transporter|nr:MAG: magnesium and cobalt transport protein CorA [Acidobacteriota bacterium]GIU81947.1 MAG: magnesium transport protein CorA [Pyrinomonadaceae bacterium]
MLEIFVYKKKEKELKKGFSKEDLPHLLRDENNLVWIDMENPSKEEEKILSEVFCFHPLTIEDAVEMRNHPKIEVFQDYLFFIFHGVKNETNSHNFVTKELDGYLGRNFLVTYHREKFRSIDAIKQQLETSSFIFQRGIDYVLHQILDRMIDFYIPVVEDFDKAISYLEHRILKMKKTNRGILEEIMDLKRSVARLIRIGSKQERVLYRISHGEFPFIDESNLPFYRDVYDHLLRVVVLAENYRDLVNGLLDIHFNTLASKTNEAIKFMTVISTIMLPLSVIAGIYGMNFEYMPELKMKYGYFVTLGVMFLVAISLVVYFWRKGWIFESKD